MRDLFRRLFHKHDYTFSQNVHGDRILVLNARSIWVCKHCGKRQFRNELHTGE